MDHRNRGGRKQTIRWYRLGILVEMELLMSFSFLGYVHIAPISITFAYIPVPLAGVLMGPPESTILGTAFGLASMWKASASYVMPADKLFSPLLSGHPVESLLLSVGTRVLFGLLVGFLYLAAKRTRHKGLWIGVISFFGRPLHSLLVYSAMWCFFPETGYSPLNVFTDFWSASSLATNLVTIGVCLLCWRVQRSAAWQKLQHQMDVVQEMRLAEHYHHYSLIPVDPGDAPPARWRSISSTALTMCWTWRASSCRRPTTRTCSTCRSSSSSASCP